MLGEHCRNIPGGLISLDHGLTKARVVPGPTMREEPAGKGAVLAAVMDASSEAIQILSLDGTIVSWNPGAETLLGYASHEVVGKSSCLLTPADSGCELQQALEKARGGQTVPAFQTVLLARNQVLVDVSLSVAPIHNAQGEAVGAVAISRPLCQCVRQQREEREGDALFRELFQHAPTGMAVVNLEGRFLKVNATLSQFFGYSEQELLAISWRDVTHPDDLQASEARICDLARNGVLSFDFEKRYIHKNGHPVWGRVKLSLLRDAQGHPEALIGQLEDITAQKQSAAAVRESEERFRIMADGCPAIMWVTDAQGQAKFINRAYCEFIDGACGDIADDSWRFLIHPDDSAAYLATWLQAIRSRSSFQAEARIRRADGEWRWIDSKAEPRFSAEGVFLGHVGLTIDNTERKQAERSLLSSEEKFRQLADHIEEVFWIRSTEPNQVLYVSPAYERIWGRSLESFYADPQSAREAVHPADRESFEEATRNRPNSAILDHSFRIFTPDGQLKWVRTKASPICDESGKIVRIVCIAEDVTEQKRYESELIEARRAADIANEAKSRFLANMSHEIRTPMNGFMGMLQLLSTTNLTPEQQQYTAVAQTSCQDLLLLVNDILDISKIEAGKVVLDIQPFRISDTIGEVMRLLRNQANSKGLAFTARISPDVPAYLSGDAHRLKQVLVNLCGNAIKFTEHGKVSLHLDLVACEERTATVRLTVSDTGIGIDEQKVGALFQPFMQADNSTTRKYGGTGLGLAICKQLIELMHGSISVASRAGEGSTFSFTAVLEIADTQRQADPYRAIASDAPTLVERNLRILVADDNAVNRKVALAQLHKLGYEAHAVVNGAEALQALDSSVYDLILMDCQMPVLDGYDTTRRIRDSRHAEIPIIALTAHAMPADRDRCVSAGMDDYLSKPMELHLLEATLKKWLCRPLVEADLPARQ